MEVLGYERPVRTRQRSAGLIGLVIMELDNPIFPAYVWAIGQGAVTTLVGGVRGRQRAALGDSARRGCGVLDRL